MRSLSASRAPSAWDRMMTLCRMVCDRRRSRYALWKESAMTTALEAMTAHASALWPLDSPDSTSSSAIDAAKMTTIDTRNTLCTTTAEASRKPNTSADIGPAGTAQVHNAK